MVWFLFILYSAVIVVAAIKLAEYGDAISIRTNLGGMFIGLLLMAGATSLPELLTSISSINQGVPDLAAGSFFGSNMFNMLLLGIIGLISWRTRILRKVARRHALTGSTAAFLLAIGIFFIMANIDLKIGWIGVDSIILLVAYIAGIYLIQTNSTPVTPSNVNEIDDRIPSLRNALIGFGLATAALIIVMPQLVSTSSEIATLTGLGTGFIGTALVSIVTSLPELVTTITAIRLGEYDMAVSNLFGSNMFNIFALGLSDVFFLNGRFLGAISPDFMLVGMIGLLMTLMGVIGNLAKMEKKFFIFELDTFLLILIYFFGMLFIFYRGIGI